MMMKHHEEPYMLIKTLDNMDIQMNKDIRMKILNEDIITKVLNTLRIIANQPFVVL